MTGSPAIWAALIGVSGVILGTVLRPWIEEWFSKRRKTLHVVIQDPSEFRAPHKSVSLNWQGHELKRLIQTGFRLENRTGRTLRNFRLEIGAPDSSNDDHIHSIYLEDDSRARYSTDKDGYRSIYDFDLIEPGVSLSGAMLSNYTDKLSVTSLDDLELRKMKPIDGSGWWRFVAGATAAASLVALTATAAAF